MTETFAELLADSDARERAAKLLRLLASDAAGEAEAARAALLRLLARHGATFDDLARLVLDPAPASSAPGEVAALRTALAVAERDAALEEAASREASAEARHLRRSRARWRAAAITGMGAGSVIAMGALATVAFEPWTARRAAQTEARPETTLPPPAPPAASPAERPPRAAVVTKHGRVLPLEGVPLRLNPLPASPSVAVLPQGTEIAVDEVFPMLGGEEWMKVRAPQGDGFVPSNAVRAEP